jgi:hypothetical protein
VHFDESCRRPARQTKQQTAGICRLQLVAGFRSTASDKSLQIDFFFFSKFYPILPKKENWFSVALVVLSDTESAENRDEFFRQLHDYSLLRGKREWMKDIVRLK